MQNYDSISKTLQDAGYAFLYASERLRVDKELVLGACQHKKGAELIQYVLESLRSDKEFMPEFVKSNPLRLIHASELLRDDREVVLAAVTLERCDLYKAFQRLQDDMDLSGEGSWEAKC